MAGGGLKGAKGIRFRVLVCGWRSLSVQGIGVGGFRKERVRKRVASNCLLVAVESRNPGSSESHHVTCMGKNRACLDASLKYGFPYLPFVQVTSFPDNPKVP